MLVFGLSGPHVISSLFSWGPLLLIGESSYCLYLLHFNVFQLIHIYRLPERLHVAALDPWISYAALIVLSIVVYRFVENPARKTLLRHFPPASRNLRKP
jgi:peptidoglycan/LPS O-acetylase OafA/YrhL